MKVSEIRTQIYLPGKLYRALKTLAREEEASLAEIIRKAAEQFLEFEAAKKFWKSGKGNKAVGMLRIGKRSSRSIDQIVYGR